MVLHSESFILFFHSESLSITQNQNQRKRFIIYMQVHYDIKQVGTEKGRGGSGVTGMVIS